MVRALLDAASLVTSSEPSQAHRLLGPLASLLEDLSAHLDRDAGATPAPILDAITEALDVEIAHWEQRASDDSDARAVLRAFLGLRELLWEFGVGRGPAEERPIQTPDATRADSRVRRSPQPRRGPRVQRVPIEG